MSEEDKDSVIAASSAQKSPELRESKKAEMAEMLIRTLIPFRDVNNPSATYVQMRPPGKAPICVETSSQELVMWLRNELRIVGSPNDVVRRVVDAVTSKARFGADERSVATRVGQKDEAWYFNLADENGTVVRITSEEWKPIGQSPVQFVHTRSTRPLPMPDKEGTLADLRRFVRIRDQEWPLYVAWLLASMSPTGPYPLAAVIGEHGSGKSALELVTSLIVDPSGDALGCLPTAEGEFRKLASRRWLLGFDNVSSINRNVSDALCRLSTGSGTTGGGTEDVSMRRPVMVTSIEDLTLENDLLDRVIWFTMPPLRDKERVAEVKFWSDFRRAYPRVLGGVLNALVEVRRNLSAIRVESLPRMADYARIGMAAEPVLGMRNGEFVRRYEHNRVAVAEMIVETSPLASLVRRFVLIQKKWTGTAQEFIKTVQTNVWAVDAAKASKDLSSPRRFSGALRKLAPSLRRMDIDVSFERSAEQRKIEMLMTRERTEEEEREVAMEGNVERPEDNIWYVLGKEERERQKASRENTPPDGCDDHDVESVGQTPAPA